MAKDRDTEPTEESAPSADDATERDGTDLHDDNEVDDTADADGRDESADSEASDGELALVGAVKPGKRRSRRRRAVDDEAAEQPARARGKGHATPKQRRIETEPERSTPVRFVSESVAELRKVVWPTSTQLRTYFVVVLVFVLFVIAFVSLLDLGFGWVILKVLG